MLRSLKDLEKYALNATDGEIGSVKDLYFDDQEWVVRYLVVDAGSWLSSRKVLISPISISHPNWVGRTLQVCVSRQQVKDSPSIDTDKPVSRQNEERFLGYYGYPYYWGGSGMWASDLYPYAIAPGFVGYGVDGVARDREQQLWVRAGQDRHPKDDPNLRSCKAVHGYHIQASDGEIGHVTGYLVDDETWAIRYLVVDTSNWWIGHQVLIATDWIDRVSWAERTVSIGLTRKSVQEAPHYDPDQVWNGRQDVGLYQHYGRTGYWADRGALDQRL